MAYLKQGADYFPHDTNARMDTRMKILTAFYGVKGYGVYFSLLEDIYKQKDYQLLVNDNYRAMFAYENKIDVQELDAIIKKCVEIGLFDERIYAKTSKLTSFGIRKRVDALEKYRQKARERQARARLNNVTRNNGVTLEEQTTNTTVTSGVSSGNDGQTSPEYSNSRVKYSRDRVEYSKENNNNDLLVSKEESNARETDKKLPSYDSIIDENCSAVVASAMREFLKHCAFHKKLPTNDKLMDIIVKLDMRYAKDDESKVREIKFAISQGWCDVILKRN